jgi:hypothetical protein
MSPPQTARPGAGERSATTEIVPDLLGQPQQQAGMWGFWLHLTTPRQVSALPTARQREYLRRSRLLSTLLLTAVILTAMLLPRGFLPVFDPGTMLGVAGFSLIIVASIILNRRGQVMAAASVFTIGLATAIAGSQLATPSGKIGFEDLAGYDLLVIPLIIAGILLPSRVSILLWIASALFIVLDLGLAQHGASLDAYLPTDIPTFLRVYPVAIYPVILTAVVAVISWLAARSVARALEEADRTAELQRAYALLAEQKRGLEEAIAAIQQVHARVANGDLSARAPMRANDPLLQLTVSLNLTLDRLARGAMSAVNLEAMDQEVAVVSTYIAELARANLHRPAPTQQLHRLAPLTFGLDQIRTGMLQAIEYTRSLVEQIGADNKTVGQHVQLLAPFVPVEPELIDLLKHGTATVDADTMRLQTYLSRFL